MIKNNCKNCTKRKVGCHSTCAEHVVWKVIRTYQNQKRAEENDMAYNARHYNKGCQKLVRQLNGY